MAMFIFIITQLLAVFKLMPMWPKIEEYKGMGAPPPYFPYTFV